MRNNQWRFWVWFHFRDKIALSEVLKSKHEEIEAYLSEIEVSFLYIIFISLFIYIIFISLYDSGEDPSFLISFTSDNWAGVRWHANSKPTSIAANHWERWLQYKGDYLNFSSLCYLNILKVLVLHGFVTFLFAWKVFTCFKIVSWFWFRCI